MQGATVEEVMEAATGVPYVAALPLTQVVLEAEGEVGRDMNGNTLLAERIAWLDERKITGDRRRVLLRLMGRANSERSKVRSESKEEA